PAALQHRRHGRDHAHPLRAGHGAPGPRAEQCELRAGRGRNRGCAVNVPYRMTLSVLLLLHCAALPAAAQQVHRAATVPVAWPTGGGVRNLTFGVVTPAGGSTQIVDVPAAVAPQTALVQSGEFRFNVAGARGIDFTVTVPTELTSAGAPPLLISFNGNQYGGYCVTTAASCTLTNFNPSLGQVLRVCRTMLFG